jgi:hypothetical protein
MNKKAQAKLERLKLALHGVAAPQGKRIKIHK